MSKDHTSGSPRPGVVVVPHTHWDREWYEPFQVFRFKLVDMFDDVLDRLERDPEFRFTLDGQTAAIEDYLEIRPENRDRVIARVQAGQLAIGPWQILLDEFLCGGETILRNLELGMRGATELGGPMPVGYVPDMFGHTAQLPQMLRHAGIAHTCLWRGVPGSVTSHAFNWVAPSGDQVRVEYLFDGYGNGLNLFSPPERLADAAREYRDRTAERYGSDSVLAMTGSDHTAPIQGLMSVVRGASSSDFDIAVARLDEYILAQPDATESVTGELRSHLRGNILPGVISIRRPLKIAMGQAERRALEAERLAALWSGDGLDPFMRLSWHRIIDSTAHDSVVGSGVDETVRQVQARLEEAEQTARAVCDGVVAAAVRDLSADSFTAFNTEAFDRTMVVEVTVQVDDPADQPALVATAADGSVLAHQIVGFAPTELGDEVIDADEYDTILARIHGRELFGQSIDSYTLDDGHLAFTVSEVPTSEIFDPNLLRREVETATRARPGAWRVTITATPRLRVLVAVPVPALGSTTFTLAANDTNAPAPSTMPLSSQVRVDADDRSIDNGLVAVAIRDDGTFDVTIPDGTTIVGVGRIVDEGDRGDSYNFGPLAADTVVDDPSEVTIRVDQVGPISAAFAVIRTYDWPTGLGDNPDARSATTVPVTITTRVEVRAGEPFIRIRTDFVNTTANHRVRFHVPLPQPVNGSSALGQYAVVDRGLTAEGGGGEFPLPTFPAYEFVAAGPIVALTTHATEYEVVDGGNELALTLLRAVGMISVNVHPLRNEPAAREFPIPEGQELGNEMWAEFALLPASDGWASAEAVRWGDHYRASPIVARGGRSADADDVPGGLPPTGIEVTGASLTALRPRAGGLWEARLVNLGSKPSTVRLVGTGSARWTAAFHTDLLHRQQTELDVVAGQETTMSTLDLGPWQIATIALTPLMK